MAIGSMPVPAPAKMANHASKVSRTRVARTTAPLRLKTVSTAFSAMASAHHAALAKMDMRKLPVSVFESEADRPSDLGPAASNLGFGEVEAVRLNYGHAVLRASDRIDDGF